MKNNYPFLNDYKGKIVVVKGTQKKDGTIIIPRWVNEKDKYLYEGIITSQNLREKLPTEFDIEFDHNENWKTDSNDFKAARKEAEIWSDRIKAVLTRQKIYFYQTDHKGKSPHIRGFINGLEHYPTQYALEYKLRLVENVLQAVKFKSKLLHLDRGLITAHKKLISLEEVPHWKEKWNGEIEKIIFENKGCAQPVVKKETMDEIITDMNQSFKTDNREISLNPINIKDVDVQKLKELFGDYYKVGTRNQLIVSFGAMCRRKDISIENTRSLLSELFKYINQEKYLDDAMDKISYAFSMKKEDVAVWYHLKKVYDETMVYKVYSKLTSSFEASKEEEEKGIIYKSLPEILANPIPKPKWRVESYVPEAGITYLASPPGEGKTMVAIYMAQCIASGRDFLGKKTLKGKVIYLDSENGEICLYDRFKRIAEGHDFHDKEVEGLSVSVFPYIRFDKDNLKGLSDFNDFYIKFKPEVIIFDSLVRFMEGSENDAESCKKVFDFLRTYLTWNPNLTIIILHHLTKVNQGGMNALRGSSELAASAASIIMLKRLQTAFKLKIEKSRYLDMGLKHELYYNIKNDDEQLVFELCDISEVPNDAVGRAQQDFWTWISAQEIKVFSSKNCQDYLKTKSHSKNTIFRLVGELLRDKYITKLSRGKYEIKNNPIATEEEVKE